MMRLRSTRNLWLGLVVLLLAAGLTSCGGKPQNWQLKDITGVIPSLEFELTDQNGATLHASDLRGSIVLLYFGYTHCPDVCPTTLATLTHAVKQLGAKGEAIRILFVSVDPARDTQDILKRYVEAFGANVVGLRGDRKTLDALTKRYRVTYGLGQPDAQGNYEVSHSSAVFVFDGKGNARLLGLDSEKADAFVQDLGQLLASARNAN